LLIAQVSEPAVSLISKSAKRENVPALRNSKCRAGFETCDTADLEVCATSAEHCSARGSELDVSPRAMLCVPGIGEFKLISCADITSQSNPRCQVVRNIAAPIPHNVSEPDRDQSAQADRANPASPI